MNSNFNITIGASPSGDISLHKELQLIKVGLIYADNVKLCSLGSAMVSSVLSLPNLNEETKIEFLRGSLNDLANTPQERANINIFLNQYKELLRKKKLSQKEYLNRFKIQKEINLLWKELKIVCENIAEESGIIELVPAIKSGNLEITAYGQDGNYDIESLVKQFYESVGQSIASGDTYPLLDEGTSNLISSGIKEGVISCSNIGSEKAKHIGFVSNIMQRLPCFEHATIDEILDIRKELKKPLVRFRSAMLKYSEQIKNEPWDTNFNYDADKLFVKEIEPAVLDIEESVKNNKYLKSILSRFIEKPLVVPATSGLGLMVSSLSNLPHMSSTALGTAVGGGALLYGATEDWKTKNREIEKNQLFFYYKAGTLVKK